MRHRRTHESPFSLFAFQDIITSVTGVVILVTLLITLALITRELQTLDTQSLNVAEDITPVLFATQQEIDTLQARIEKDTETISALADISASQVRRELHELQLRIDSVVIQNKSLRDQLRRTVNHLAKWKSREREVDETRELLESLEVDLQTLLQKREELLKDNSLIYNPQQASGKAAWLVDIDGHTLRVSRLRAADTTQVFENTSAFLRWAKERDRSAEYFVLMVRPAGIVNYRRIYIALTESNYDLGIDLIGQDHTVIAPK